MKTVLHRVLRLLARPMRGDEGRGGIVIYPYRGYGSRDEAFIMGRVFRQPGRLFSTGTGEGSLSGDAIDLGRRILRRGVGGAILAARFGGIEQRITTDRDGYFRVHMRRFQPPPPDRLWHQMDLEVVDLAGGRDQEAGASAPTESAPVARAEVFVPPASARFVVISDIDDTVMVTGVANKIKMMYRLFRQDARSRVAFPGVAAFYRALHQGISGAERNPMLYVSRGPWSIYEVLEEFFRIHGIPVGPILFLREWGLTLQRPLPRRAKEHKGRLIREMLSLYDDLPFVLIGDSGQHDPELYRDIVREHPGRVLSVYIRNITAKPARSREIETLAEDVVAAGSALLLAADTLAMAEHAASHGLIAPHTLAAVADERRREEDGATVHETAEVSAADREQTQQAVEHGAVADALAHDGSRAEPPNVLIEAEDDRTRKQAAGKERA
jgi:phosphatidate phosphatase APP1